MKRVVTILFISCSMLLSSRITIGQDLHFSQFMQSPLLTNPANTGFIPEGDYRIGINYRNQWASLTASPYKTMSAFGDVQLLQNRDQTGWLGAGGLILRDVAGTAALTSTKVYGSLAYHQMVNNGSLVSLGFNVGWANKRINTTNLTFPSQWNGQFFDVHQTGLAPAFDATAINYLDIQTGVNYAYFPNSNTYMNAGFSAMHINRPIESFWNTTTGIDNRIAVRYNAFLNGSFRVNDRLILHPNMYFSTQASAWELVGGLSASYDVSGVGDYVLSLGTYYRVGESFIPSVGLGFSNLLFNFSYDVTSSSLKNYINRRGAFEFSLIKQGLLDPYQGNRRQSLCPSFQ